MKKLDDDQRKVVDSLLTESIRPAPGSLVAGELGTGKTIIAVEFLKEVDARRVLVICPKNTFGFSHPERKGKVKYIGWIGTLAEQKVKLPVRVVNKRSDIIDGNGVFIINPEFLVAVQKPTKTEDGVNWSKVETFDLVIFDEIQIIGNRKNQVTRAANQVSSRFNLGLSGTPFRTKFDNMWSVCRWIWHGDDQVVSRSYWAWRGEWCRTKVQRFGARQVETVMGEKNEGTFITTLPNYHRLLSDKKAVMSQIYVDLTPAQRKVYRQMEQDAIMWVRKHGLDEKGAIVASIPLVKRIRLREVTLGLPEVISETDDDDEITTWLEFPVNCVSAKLDAVQQFLKTHDEPVLIFTHSAKFAEVIHARLGGGIWTGNYTTREREESKARFMDGRDKILTATIRSLGTGTDGLQTVCNTAIFMSRDDSDTENLQAIGRLDRRGQEADVVSIIDVIAYDTYDEGDLSDEALAIDSMQKTLHGKSKKKGKK